MTRNCTKREYKDQATLEGRRFVSETDGNGTSTATSEILESVETRSPANAILQGKRTTEAVQPSWFSAISEIEAVVGHVVVGSVDYRPFR